MKKARPDVSDLAGKKFQFRAKEKTGVEKKVSIPASVWWIFCYVTLLRWFESLQTGPGSFKNVTPRRPYFGPQDAKKARNSGLFSYWDHFVPVEMAGAEGLEPSARGFGVDVGKCSKEQGRAGVARFLPQVRKGAVLVWCWEEIIRAKTGEKEREIPAKAGNTLT